MRFTAIEHPYLWLLGTALLLEGATMLVIGVLPPDFLPMLVPTFPPDPLHNAIHVAWGVVMVILLASGLKASGTSLMAVSFGVFYVGLAIAGILVDRPLGLHLGPGENVFHWIVGPTSLLIGIMALRQRRIVETA